MQVQHVEPGVFLEGLDQLSTDLLRVWNHNTDSASSMMALQQMGQSCLQLHGAGDALLSTCRTLEDRKLVR